MSSLSLLVIAAHPDDAELSVGGTLLAHKLRGYKTGILDLTRGELGTRGSTETRMAEAKIASEVLKLDMRYQAGLPDGKLSARDPLQVSEVIKYIRQFRPHIVITNAPNDRHPDHSEAYLLAKKACFLSGLAKLETDFEGLLQPAWRPKLVFHYVQDTYLPVDLVVDITDCFDKKLQAIKAYKSQFYDASSHEPNTYISDEKYFEYIRARAVEFGHAIGVLYGEGLIKQQQIKIENLFELI